MQKWLLTVAGVLLLATAGVYSFIYLGDETNRSAEDLARLALTAATPEARELAALELGGLGADALPQIRQVLAQSDSPVIRAAMCQSLGSLYDFASMPALLPLLQDESEILRRRAGAAVTTIIGIDFLFRADDPPEQRSAAIHKIKLCYDSMVQNPPPKYRRS